MTIIMTQTPKEGAAQAGAARYVPAPHDTSAIRLDGEMSALTEDLAKNTHEVWAAQRVAEGWRCGPQRDETRREHPGLVPYEDLPDSEKQYDRSTALETLRLILALGYRISRT